MCMVLLQHSRPLKIPKEELPIAIPTTHEPPIRTESQVTCITSSVVALHFFLSLQTVPIPSLVDNNAIVEALAEKKFLAWVHGNNWHGMHGGVRNVFDWYSDVPFPHQYLFIVTRRDHLHAIVFDKGDCVHRGQMVIILLRNFPSEGIKRDNLMVRASHDKYLSGKAKWMRMTMNKQVSQISLNSSDVRHLHYHHLGRISLSAEKTPRHKDEK